MPKRSYYSRRMEANRTQRKALWIRTQNLIKKYPDGAFDVGTPSPWYCNHVYDPEYPWQWVDFRVFHTKLKRYFAVAMTTVLYDAYQIAEDKAWEEAEKVFPREDTWEDGGDINEWVTAPNPIDDQHYALFMEFKTRLLKEPQVLQPSIIVKDYGPVVVGVWTSVNKEHIDEHVIRDWIAQYKSLGEPVTPGFSWKGEAVEVIPSQLEKS